VKLFLDEREEIKKAFLNLCSQNYTIVDDIKDADLAILGKNKYTKKKFESAISLKWVIITKSGCIEHNISTKVGHINFIRIDLGRQIFIEIIEKMNYSILISREYGVRQIENDIYCSGGFVGAEGSVIVDNVNNIRHKYGISNGDGSINYF
jgi:hypothetical protein